MKIECLVKYRFLSSVYQYSTKMSVVPLMFRDWWDDWDTRTPFRTSRILDQHFGTGLSRDELLSSFWKPSPSLLRSGYVRPWSNHQLQRQDSASTLNLDKDKFQVSIVNIFRIAFP